MPLLIIGALVAGASSLRVSVPTEEHQYCLQAAKDSGNKKPNCPTDESVWKRGLSDPVAYYTLWLTVFTGVLAGVGIGQGYLIGRQINLARDEFEATHRPKVIVREVYWEPDETGTGINRAGKITIILANTGSRDAYISEFHTEFNRTDERPILHDGTNIPHEWKLSRGTFQTATVGINTSEQFSFGAFSDGMIGIVNYQGLIIYTDDAGVRYRSVFKRRCSSRETVFVRTDNPDDEYSD